MQLCIYTHLVQLNVQVWYIGIIENCGNIGMGSADIHPNKIYHYCYYYFLQPSFYVLRSSTLQFDLKRMRIYALYRRQKIIIIITFICIFTKY